MINVVFVDSITLNNNELNDNINLGLYSLLTVLNKERKFRGSIINFNRVYKEKKLVLKSDFESNIDDISKYIIGLNPDIISFYTLYKSHFIALSVAKKIKEINSNIKILLGGPHATIAAHETLEKYDFIDAIGVGEGEGTIVKIIKSIHYNDDLDNVHGLAYLKEGKVKINDSILVENLDEIPMIDYSLVEGIKDVSQMPIDVGRGCPYSCTFCTTKNFWSKKYRIKSTQRIIDEIKVLISDYGCKYFNFLHDNFTCNKKQVISICDEIIKNNFNITFECSSRADLLDEEIIKKLYSAGCRMVLLGIETGSMYMQKSINKNLDLEKTKKIIECLKENKIGVATSFIMGYPNEQESDLSDTFKFIHQLALRKVDRILCNKLEIIPGAELFEKYKDNLSPKKNYSRVELGNVTNKDITLYLDKVITSDFYEYNTILNEEIFLLQFIIGYVYKIIYKKFFGTYKLIIEYFNDNLLKFLKDLREEQLQLLLDFREKVIKEEEYNDNEVVEIVERYIMEKSFEKNTCLIRSLFKLEKGINEVVLDDSIEFLIIDFPIDILRYLHDKYETNINYNVKLRISKQMSNKILVGYEIKRN